MTVATEILPANILEACPLPNMEKLEEHRRDMTRFASTPGDMYWPSLRQQLQALLEKVNAVDAAVMTLIICGDTVLGNIDIAPYQQAILLLDKPGRTTEESRACLQYQEEVSNLLCDAAASVRTSVHALDASLLSLETSSIDDVLAPIAELQARLETATGAQAQRIRDCLDDFRGILGMDKSRAGYVHEVSKLVFAVNYFFDNVLEGSPDVIQRAEDFLRHADELVDYLRELHSAWKS
ncbi:hypothetical protein [Pseudomonas syringae]|uniref:Binary cytotoxin component n=1 Tax=Pseudomonas syringae TaxID=317 RepID=A0A085UN07_PSESX|nr:hypothetical protein [Pseudomonas syringae]KFE44570.1 hypothetical protein IV02_29490 [Pseudomonas syringae]